MTRNVSHTLLKATRNEWVAEFYQGTGVKHGRAAFPIFVEPGNDAHMG